VADEELKSLAKEMIAQPPEVVQRLKKTLRGMTDAKGNIRDASPLTLISKSKIDESGH